jgi:hypothetical protein
MRQSTRRGRARWEVATPRRPIDGSSRIEFTRKAQVGFGHPEAAYRRFVEEGLATMPEDPFREAVGGWLLGSPKFVDRVRAGMTLPRHPDAVSDARRLACYD